MSGYNQNRPGTQMRRGSVWYIAEDPLRRPVGSEIWSNRMGVIVSNDALNRSSPCVEVVWLSTSSRRKPAPTHANLYSTGKKAYALCEQIQTVDKSRLHAFICRLSHDEMNDIDEGILFALQINAGKSPDGIFRKYENELMKEREIKKQKSCGKKRHKIYG